MGHHTYRQKSGFTIIELLIVVVVIAVLAIIAAVSYNYVVKLSYNSQIKSGVQSYYEAVKAYKLAKGVYPQTQREQSGQRVAMTCLGKGYKNQACGEVTGVKVYEDSLFNSQMASFLKTTTDPVSDKMLPVPGETFIGAVYGIDVAISSSTGYGRVIEYAMYGDNADCGIIQAYSYSTDNGTTACEILLEEVSF